MNRVSYSVFVKNTMERKHYFDFNGEDYGYGRRDKKGILSFVDEARLATVPASKEVKVLDFVARAWADCKKELEGYVTARKIKGDLFLRNLTPESGYASPHADHYSIISKNIIYYMKRIEKCNHSISGLSNEILSMVQNEGVLLTKTAYMGSVRNSVRSTGLSMEFSKENFSNDAKKDIAYFQSKSYSFYCRTLRKYGFRIDINAPWRVVFDIYSTQGKKYIEGNYLLNSFNYDLEVLRAMIPYFFKVYLLSHKKSIPADLELEESTLLMYYARVRCAEVSLDARKTQNVIASLGSINDPLLYIDKECNVI
jgi:hypothetical protein